MRFALMKTNSKNALIHTDYMKPNKFSYYESFNKLKNVVIVR